MVEVADCIFCRIVKGAIPCFKLHEDARTLAFMDINPFHDGHCLVITKAHAENLYRADDADLAAAVVAAKRLAIAVERALKPDGINLVQANGAGAGQSVFHFHFHVFPRKLNDDAQFNWGHKPGDKARIGELADRIRLALP
jgi:histidine triad (HIT) family protein